MSFIVQCVIVVVAVIIPLIHFEVLPKTQLTSFLVAPPPPPPPPPPPAAAPVKMVKIIPRQFDAGRLMAPKAVPKDIAIIKEEELPPPSAGGGGVVGGIPGGGSGGAVGGILGGVIGSIPQAAPPPPPPEVKKVEAKPVARSASESAATCRRPGLSGSPSRCIRRWPSRLVSQGVVRFTAIISKDGTIQSLQLISGHPLLTPSAMEAVKQWVYQPTLLNGEPVEVVTQIDVNFTLSQ